MNKENLLKMADYIETIPQESFDMSDYRTGQWETPECNSVGCIIGHCTVLDKVTAANVKMWDETIDFQLWSYSFTKINVESAEWDYLFHSMWKYADNTPTGAAKRIRYFVENGLPDTWEEEMYRECKLSYM